METTKKTTKEYFRTVGRRKTASATVKMVPSKAMEFTVNGKPGAEYFMTKGLFKIITDPFTESKIEDTFTVTVQVQGGGIHSQAEAVRHGITRALTLIDSELRTPLKKIGFLKRDPRTKERRKFGLKKARKAPQWSKR
jgi:small subunit ribosomal protein S9